MTFAEQLKGNKNPAIAKIAEYLQTRSDMKEKLDNDKKSLNEMFDYIVSEANKQRNGNCACVDDETVFGWAIHYYDEDNIEFKKIGNVKVSSDNKKEEKTISKKVKKGKVKNELEGQLSLF